MRSRLLTGAMTAWWLGSLSVASGGSAPIPRRSDRTAAAALAKQAEARAAAGDLAGAVESLEQAEAQAPDWPELKVNLAAARSRAGDYAGAIRSARAALDLDPALDGARFNLGLAQFKAGESTGAVEALARYQGNERAPVAVHVALGLALGALDRPAESAAALGFAVARGSRDPGVLYALAKARQELGNEEGAREARDLLAAAAPGSAAHHMTEGDARDRARDWPAAEAAYRRALAADERFPGAHYSVGLMLFKQRRYAEAAPELDRERERQPEHPPALYYRALLELDQGHAALAVPLLEAATRAAPRMQEAWRDLGRAEIEMGNHRSAVAALRRAVDLDPEDARAWFLLHRALRGDGQATDAGEALRRATELNRRLRQELQEKVSGPEPKPPR